MKYYFDQDWLWKHKSIDINECWPISVQRHENTVCAFQITYNFLYFTFYHNWKIPEEICRRFNNLQYRLYLQYQTHVHTTFYHVSGLTWNRTLYGWYIHDICTYHVFTLFGRLSVSWSCVKFFLKMNKVICCIFIIWNAIVYSSQSRT